MLEASVLIRAKGRKKLPRLVGYSMHQHFLAAAVARLIALRAAGVMESRARGDSIICGALGTWAGAHSGT